MTGVAVVRGQASRLVVLAALAGFGCGQGTTGSGLLELPVSAAAAVPADEDGARRFTTAAGYTVTLTRAELRVGALYVNQSVPAPGAQQQSCLLPGLYVLELTEGLVVDALDPAAQPFPALARALAERGVVAQLWLIDAGEEVDAPASSAVVLEAAGIARRGEERWPFELAFTLGQRWRIPDPDPHKPGANPSCSQRIVSPIPVALEPRDDVELQLTIDPARWFDRVPFAALGPGDGEAALLHRFPDAPEGEASQALYAGVKSATAYRLRLR